MYQSNEYDFVGSTSSNKSNVCVSLMCANDYNYDYIYILQLYDYSYVYNYILK